MTPSETSIAVARRMDAEKREIEKRHEREALLLLLMFRQDFGGTTDFAAVAAPWQGEIAAHLADAMAEAHVLGLQRVWSEAAPHLPAGANAAAGTGRDYLDELRGIYQPEAEEAVKAMIDGMLNRLGPDATAVEIQAAFRASGLVRGQAAGMDTAYETTMAKAYSDGMETALTAPAIKAIHAGYEWVTMRDDAVRWSHAAMDGVARPTDDAVWTIWQVPAGWGCRCCRVPIFTAIEWTATLPAVYPDEGF